MFTVKSSVTGDPGDRRGESPWHPRVFSTLWGRGIYATMGE
jgi:hypothetical protein